jgi:alanine-alpha-ketoisovalerate/valine-pyruvate aminotransferase
VLKFVGVVVDVENGKTGVSGRRCGFINAAPQLINEAQSAENSISLE